APAQAPPKSAKLRPAAARKASRPTAVSRQAWKTIIDEGKNHSQVMTHLDVLANRIGPRLTSSENLTTACEWARDYLKSLGYENARLERWGSFRVGFNRGPWFGEVTAPETLKQSLECVTMAWSAGTRGRQSGPAILMPKTLEELTALGEKIEEAWLLGAIGGRRRYSAEFRAIRKHCEKAGILGFVSGSRGKLLVTGGQHRIRWSKLPKLPMITLRRSQYRAIRRALKEGTEVTLSFDIRNHFKKGPIPLYNVIADLPGRIADEYVIVGGHIDSWDGATGTTDNGTGVATTLEAARILEAAGVQPERTIRFMLWSGEEQGLMGSRAWVNKHRDQMKKISAVLVHDMGTNYVSGINAYEAQRPYIDEAFAGFETIDPDYGFSVKTKKGEMPGSDHFSFHQAGAPGFFWRQSGKAVYRYTHHTQFDTYEQAIEAYQSHSATVIALAALSIANLPELLPRPPKGAGLGGFQISPSRFGLHLEKDSLVVKGIDKGSRLEILKLEPRDKLLAFNGTKFKDSAHMMQLMFNWAMSGKSKGKLRVERAGKEIDLEIENPMGGADDEDDDDEPEKPQKGKKK
ncbi:MAG: M20/M25/M40 family metallo-hydrolase, partial [Planctomycetota bacterium]